MNATTRATRLGAVALAIGLVAGCDVGGPVDTSQMVPPTQPVAIDTPPPTYPPELACADQGGTAGLLMDIDAEGHPADIRVESSSGHAPLDQAAVEAVEGWQFRPATRNGEPVRTQLRVPVTFSPPAVRPDMCFALDEQG